MYVESFFFSEASLSELFLRGGNRKIETFHWTWSTFDDKNNAGTLPALEVEHICDVSSDISLGIKRPKKSLPEFWIRMHNAHKNKLTKESVWKTDSV